MGTISDKLMRIINTKEDIRRALISKGYDVPTSIPFKEYAKMILDLPCNADSFPDIEGIVARYSALGLTNEQMAENPVWKDLTGNGHDLQMKNFAWKGMSGVGGYGDENYQTFYKFTLDDYVFIASPPGVKHMNFTFRVTGLQPGNKLTLAFFGTTNTVYGTWDKDGIYTVNSAVVEVGKPVYFYNGYGATRGEFTIEILPLYPGFILGDGVDDFAVTEKELNFEDTYTVYTAFIPFQNNPTRNMILCGADSKKTFSMQYSSLVYVSFIAGNNYYINADFVNGLNLFACKRNGNNICIKNLLTNKVVTGTCGDWVENAGLYYLWKNATYASFARAAIAGQTICNGYFSTDEDDEKVLNWYKKQYPWLFPDQAWTVTGKTNEDEDRATIANITGNGNDLVLSNFGFAEGSGYGLYAQNYISYAITNRAVYTKTNSSIHVTKSITAGVNFTESARDVTIPSYRIKVTGIQSGQEMIYRGSNNTFLTNIPSDGIYVLPAVENGSNLGFQFVSYTGDCDITIEQIPEYEGYLVTDGVDDIASSNTLVYEADFTFIGEWKFIQKDNTVAGINSVSHLYIQNRYNRGATVMINSTFENKKNITDYMTFKAITSKGKGYDENWNEVDLLYGDGNKGTSVVNIGGQGGTEFCHMLFKNMALYMNKVFSKDDCIKAYNYLQTLKSK
jgi:hypothetical protein|nr:MAG TPA: hypothetical protein [Caudoviricetes sp.]